MVIKYLKYICFFAILMLFCGNAVMAQRQNRISGYVTDKRTGELLIGANIIDTLSGRGTATDNNGYFTFQVKENTTLQASFIGYKKEYFLTNTSDSLIKISLEPETTIDAVTITAQRYVPADASSISVKQLMQIPSMTGKPDIGKALQMLPGISTQNEGSSLLLVRGGDPGQNMYLFDNIPVIYVNHLGGFMSVFNPEIINHIDIYKGGFPARYGGKLSSIIDIIQKEGDNSHTKGSLSIGITDASFSVEGPLKKLKNTTFILTGRKTMIDPFMALITGVSDGNDFIMFYGFHDLNGKLTWKPNTKNTFNLNLYYGDDYLNYSSTNSALTGGKNKDLNIWGNWLVSGHWKSVISPNIHSNTSVSYTRYRLKERRKFTDSSDHSNDYLKKYISTVENYSLKTEFKYTPFNNWTIGFGGEAMLSRYVPFYSYDSNESTQSKNPAFSWENSLFVDNVIRFLQHSKINAGARLVAYNTKGFSNLALEPRLSLSLGLNKNHHINLSYMDVNQHSHLLFTSGGIMNNEVWIPSDRNILPSSSRQYTGGWSGNFKHGEYSAEVQFFYKEMRNLTTYKEGYSSLSGDVNWQNKIETGGTGQSKGIEVFISKNTGKLTGFLSYTLSNTTRRYPGINNGKTFTFDYDRLNQFSITANYKINDKLSIHASWTYMTGLPYTPAIGKIQVPSFTGDGEYYEDALLYGERNSARMKDYHRLDLGLTYEVLTKRNRRAVWTFSVYNAYNRKNPYYYYYNTHDGDYISRPNPSNPGESLSLYQVSFFPIIPSVSYKIYFDGTKRKNNNKPKKSTKNKLRNLLYYDD